MPQIIGICDSEGSLVWLIVLFVYKGIIMMVGVFIAFEIRKVKMVSLNESRFIGMSVYGVVIVSIALTPIGFRLEDVPSIQYSIIAFMMLLSITVILILVFGTKVWNKIPYILLKPLKVLFESLHVRIFNSSLFKEIFFNQTDL